MPDHRTPAPTRPATPNEEPELGSEESVPSDGKDPVGEKMIEELGRSREPQPAPKESGAEPMPEQFPAS